MHFWQDKNINGEASANEKKATFTAILADVRKYRKDNENEPPKAIHKKAVAMTEAERTSNRLYNRLGFLNRKIKEDEKYLDGPGYSAEEKVELLNILEGMFKDSDILADVRKYRKDNGNKLPEYIHKKAVAMTGTERTSNRLYARLNLLNRKIKKDEKYLDELGYSAEEKAELLNILKGTFAVIVQRNAKIIALIDKWMLENNKQKDGQPFSSIDEFIQYLRGNPGYEAKTPRKITKYGGENIGGWINTLRQGKNSSVEESEKKHLRDLRIYTEAESQEARNKIILSLIDEWMLENNKQKNGQPFSSIDELIQYLKENPEYKAKTPMQSTQYGGENIGKWINGLRQGKNSSIEESDKEHLRDLRIYTEAESQEARNKIILSLIDEWMLENNKQKNGQPFSSIDALIQYLKENPGYEAKTPAQRTEYDGENIGIWINTLRQGKNSSVEESEKEHLRDLRISTETHRGNSARHLDVRKATGEQLKPLARQPRRIINYANPLSVGTALLNGRFAKDATNIFNPAGLNTPDISAKHEHKYPAERSFTDQQAVETTLYASIRDLLRHVESRTNFSLPKPNRRRTPPDPETHNKEIELYKVSAAEDFVLELAEKIPKKDSDMLLDAYLTAAAAPEDLVKAIKLNNILQDLKIEHDTDLAAAYCLVLSVNYEDIMDLLGNILLKPNSTRDQRAQISLVVSDITSIKDNFYNEDEFYSDAQLLRFIRIELLNIAPETQELMRKITAEAEELAGN